MQACAGLHIRSGGVPRCPEASPKHSAASEDVIPPNHRDPLCVVWQIGIYLREINEKHWKINGIQWKITTSDDSETVEFKCCVSTLTLSRPLGAFPKCQTEVAHSPRFLDVTVYGVCMVSSLNHENHENHEN